MQTSFHVRNQMFIIKFLDHQLFDTKNVNWPKNSSVEKRKSEGDGHEKSKK